MADDRIDIQFGAQISGLVSGTQAVKSQIEGLTAPITQMRSALTGIGQAIAAAFAVQQIAEFVSKVAELGERLTNISEITGLATDKLVGWKGLMEDAGSSIDSYVGAQTRLSNAMAAARGGAQEQLEAFKAVGISAAELNTLSIDQVLMRIADAYAESANGAEKMTVNMRLLGRGASDMIPVLNQGSDAIREYIATEAAYNPNSAMIAGMAETDGKIDDLGRRMGQLSQTVWSLLKPAFDVIIDGLVDFTQNMIVGLKETGALRYAFEGLAAVLKIVVVAITAVSSSLQILWAIGKGVVLYLLEGFKTLGEVIYLTFTLRFDEAKARFITGMSEMANIVRTAGASVVEAGEDFSKVWDKIWKSGGDAVGTAPASSSRPALPNLGDANAARKELETLLATLSAKQAALKDDYEAVLRIENEKLSAIEKVYGQDSKNYQDALRNKIRMEEEFNQKLRALAVERINTESELRRVRLDDARSEIDFQRQLGAMTERESIEAKRRIAEQEYQIDREKLVRQRDLDNTTLADREKLNNQIQLLDAKFATQQVQSQRDMAMAVKRVWDGILGGISSAISQSIRGIIQGTTTLKEAMNNLAQSIILTFVDMGIQLLMNWIATQIAMMILGKTTASGTALTSVMADAARAGAAAYASTAAIPIIGPALAPAAATVAYAGTAAYAAAIPFAAQGYDVPQDTLAYIHKKEMVLPEQLSEGIRDMVSGGRTGGGDTYNIKAVDVDSFRRLLRESPNAVASALRMARRNYALPRTT